MWQVANLTCVNNVLSLQKLLQADFLMFSGNIFPGPGFHPLWAALLVRQICKLHLVPSSNDFVLLFARKAQS